MDTWRDTKLQIDYAREEGVKEEEEKGVLKMAKKLLKTGTPMNEVAELSELPLDELMKLLPQ